MNTSFWNGFDIITSGRALLSVWKEAFGDDFGSVEPFLVPTTELAQVWPCPRAPSCGCDHEVREDLEGGFVAVCTCGDGDCEPVGLEPGDLAIHALDKAALGVAVASALGLRTAQRDHEPHGGRTVAAGLEASVHAPAYLCLANSSATLMREAELLLGEGAAPFLLLTPTATFWSSEMDSTLRRAGCASLALPAVLEPAPDGGFRLSCPIEPLVEQWSQRIAASQEAGTTLRSIHRELVELRRKASSPAASDQAQPDEDVARSAFALVQRLDSERKQAPPTMLTVFRLYCMEELSVAQIARKCECGKATVVRRLAMLRQRTEHRPETTSAASHRIWRRWKSNSKIPAPATSTERT